MKTIQGHIKSSFNNCLGVSSMDAAGVLHDFYSSILKMAFKLMVGGIYFSVTAGHALVLQPLTEASP